MHLVAVDLTTGSMGLLRFKEKINTGSVQHFRQHYAFACEEFSKI
ncbi:hypothetical protein CLOSCI_02924 [[Clostridium] scindens ATCC 35704]|nr:hypothetical protein CLOSCI_02924 [[Clostridium] scindens ATCC 35704]